jgi:hypothetical protein
VMLFLMGTIMIDPFVGFLKKNKIKTKTDTLPVKNPQKETKPHKEKSRSVFADRWKVLD